MDYMKITDDFNDFSLEVFQNTMLDKRLRKKFEIQMEKHQQLFTFTPANSTICTFKVRVYAEFEENICRKWDKIV